MIREVVGAVLKAVLHLNFKYKVKGTENIPDGGAVLAVNHKSFWDVCVVGASFPRPLRIMAKSELFENKIIGGFLKALGGYSVERGKGDIAALRTSLDIVKGGDVMLIFPEGTRCDGTDTSTAKAGVALIASSAKVPVIPAYITGNYKFRSPVTITYGKPYILNDYGRKRLTSSQLQAEADIVLQKIRDCKDVDLK